MNKYEELLEASRDLQEVMKLTSHPRKFDFAREKGMTAIYGDDTLTKVHDYMRDVYARWHKAVGAFND